MLYLTDDEDEDITWYPKEKLRYVKRKLKGENSRLITRYVQLHSLIIVI